MHSNCLLKPLTRMVALAAAGCAVGPDFRRPDAPVAAQYTAGAPVTGTIAADGKAQVFTVGKRLQADWWRLFGSPALNALIVQAHAHNPGVDAAQASLRQSEFSLRAGYGIFFPQVTGNAAVARQQASPLRFGLQSPGTVFNLFTLSASVSYTLDIFGGKRRIEKLEAQVDIPRYALLATYLTLSANVVNTAIARASYLAQIQATQELVELETQQLRISEAQAKAGTQSYADVLAVQSQIASTQALVPPLQQSCDRAGHLLATLMGQTPAEAKLPEFALGDFTLPAELPLGLPSELVQQRPDILVAEAALHAASAEIGLATAAMIPSLSLTAGYGANNSNIGKLFTSPSEFWNIGAGITAPIFDGGTLWFQRKAAIEAHQQLAATYRETVLAAFAQVADALRALEHDAQTLAAQSRAVRAAQDSLKLRQISYDVGVASYLQVLAADQQLLQARVGEIRAQGQRLQDTVALYAALGGGWWNTPEAAAKPEAQAVTPPSAPQPPDAAPRSSASPAHSGADR